MNRTCGTCGSAMPRRTHRQRDSDGNLVCDSCKALGNWKQGAVQCPGSGRKTFTAPGQGYYPVEHCPHCGNTVQTRQDGSMKNHPARRTAATVNYFEVIVRQGGDDEYGVAEYGTTDLAEAISMADQVWEDEDPAGVKVMNRGNGTVFWSDGASTDKGRFAMSSLQDHGLSTLGHDSGDNAIINHCPFCGGGALVARSDGAVSCSYCHSNFTVQVQPEYPNAPQTIDGNPNQIPGMPGDTPTEMSAPTDPAVPEQNPGHDTPINPEKGTPPGQPADGAPPKKAPFGKAPAPGKAVVKPGEPPTPGGKPKGNLPPWLKKKKSMLVTAQGVALEEDAYVKHLAIHHADDPASVLVAVRADNAR